MTTRSRLQTADRSADVLETVVAAGSISLAEVQRRLGLGRTVAHRLLQTWTALGFLSFEPERKVYRAGVRLLGLGLRVREALDNADLNRRLRAVAEEIGFTANAGLLYGRQVFYIGRAESRYVTPLPLDVGTALPAHATAIGRVLLAFQPAKAVRAMYGGEPLQAYGEHDFTDLNALLAELNAIARRGYAVGYSTFSAASGSVAIPLRDAGGRVVAAMNAVGPIDAFDRATIVRKYLPVMRRAAGASVALPALFGSP